jgi:hypothetical protein
MSPDLTDTQLHAFLDEGLSQREIERRTGISRATVQYRIKRLGLQDGLSPVHRPPPPVDRPPSTVDRGPSTVDLQALLTAALQPVLARFEALEMGLARPREKAVHCRPSTIHGPP